MNAGRNGAFYSKEQEEDGTMRRRDADMTQGVIWKQFVAFSVPMAIGLLFQQLYNTVDTLVVGRFVGKEALAAVGSTGSIINMMVGLCAGLSTGASVVISQTYGSHDHRRLHDAVHTTISVTFILCLLATAAGLLLIDPMLAMMDTPEDVLPDARVYLTIYFAGMTGLLIYNMGSGILRAVGDSRRPLYFLVFSALINTVFDLVFVVYFDMGVRGVAVATILAQGLSALLVLVTLTREQGPYGIRWRELGISMQELKQILGIGMPSAVQQGITSFSNVFVQSYINAFGSACMAGYSSYSKLDAFILIPVQSIALASTTFVGQNWGAKQPERARQGVRQAMVISLIATVSLTLGMLCFAHPLMSLFSSDEEVIDYGVRFLTLVTPFYFTICFNQIYGGALRGVGNAKAPMIIMLSSFVVFRQLYLLVTRLLHLGFVSVALAYPMGWLLCSTLLIICYRRSVLFRPVEEPVQEKNSAAA